MDPNLALSLLKDNPNPTPPPTNPSHDMPINKHSPSGGLPIQNAFPSRLPPPGPPMPTIHRTRNTLPLQLAVPEKVTPNGEPMSDTETTPAIPPALQNLLDNPPPSWNLDWRRGPLWPPRIEDVICPRCAPLMVVCYCEPPGSGNKGEPRTVLEFGGCCTIL